jgi:FtsP/CotA-like multicopper oxidase with cupredoxin domain
MSVSRRDALKLGGLAALGAAGVAVPLNQTVSGSSVSQLPPGRLPQPYVAEFRALDVLNPVPRVDTDGPFDFYDLTARTTVGQIVPGLGTPLLSYVPPGAVSGVVPPPRIDVDQGTRVVLRMHDQLPGKHPTFGTPTNISTHLHGSASLPQYDGYAGDITKPGQRKDYHYPNFQSAHTLWYHDHAVDFTAENVYSGLASQYHLHDELERSLLPTWSRTTPDYEFDVGLMVSDMMFQADGSELFDDRSHSGLWGDVILVNGRPWPVMKVQRRVYRFRILDASISRSYRFTLSPPAPVWVVATDSGLVPRSQQVTQWRQATAERYEILIDFAQFKAGQRVELRNLSNPNNRDFTNTNKVMAFDVVDTTVDTSDPTAHRIPTVLNPDNETMNLTATPGMKVRNIRFERDGGEWTLNGQTWQDVINSGFKAVLADPALNATEIWQIENSSGGWFHPVHIHLIDFKILNRNGKPPFAWELGPKDTVYVGEGETVQVIAKFGPHRGRYMIHCHNLPHEDHDMMHQFRVGLNPGDADPNDPITADPPVPDTTA